MPNPAPVSAKPPPLASNAMALNYNQYVTGSGADIWTLDGLSVAWNFIVFRDGARLTPAGKFAADAQMVAYLTAAKMTSIEAARGTAALSTGARWMWNFEDIYGYPTLVADQAAQIALWVTLLGVGANVQKGGNP